MKPLRLRVSLFATAFALIGCGSSGLALWTIYKINSENQKVRQSIVLRDWVETLPNLTVREDTVRELQEYRSLLTPPERQNALSDIIQAYNGENRPLLRKRIESFIYLEKKFVSHLSPQITRHEQQVFYFGVIAVSAFLLGFYWFRNYLVKNILEHLEDITLKMMDFLNGKYSYQFEVPTHNEVGDLQTTFNAMAQRVLQNMDELKALDTAKSDFLNIASHELRTPMTSIKGSLGLLTSGVMGEIPAEALQLVDIAETETNRLIRLTNDILDMAKIEAGKFPLNLHWTSLNELLETTKSGLIGLCEAAQVTMSVETPFAADAHIDKDRIQQVITNLASNAVKFSPKNKNVTIGFEIIESSNLLRVFVSDQGRGISPDDQKLLFEKFRQVTGPETPLVKGTGLGLAIAKALVEEHQGTIGVESTPGSGSTFFFTLPDWKASEMESDEHQNTDDETTGVAA